MAMHIARDPNTGRDFRFRDLGTLIKRFGGDSIHVEHDPAFEPAGRTVLVLKYDRRVNASHVRATVRMDADTFRAVVTEAEKV